MRHTDNRLDTGFNFTVGTGLNFTPTLGVLGQFGYNQLGVNSSVLQNEGVPNCSGRIYSLTLSPIVHLNPRAAPTLILSAAAATIGERWSLPSRR